MSNWVAVRGSHRIIAAINTLATTLPFTVNCANDEKQLCVVARLGAIFERFFILIARGKQ